MFVKLNCSVKFLYPKEGLVTRNTHMKYENPITSNSKVIVSVKAFQSNQLHTYEVKILILKEKHFLVMSVELKLIVIRPQGGGTKFAL
jgi:hypothetical protein